MSCGHSSASHARFSAASASSVNCASSFAVSVVWSGSKPFAWSIASSSSPAVMTGYPMSYPSVFPRNPRDP